MNLALPLATAVFGAASSLHCAAMCGPLSSCLLAAPPVAGRPPTTPGALAALYQTGRWCGYAAAGAIAGSAGGQVEGWLGALAPLASWALALAMGAAALGLAPRVNELPILGPLLAAGLRRAASWPPARRAFALGLATPALPCGLLYAALGLSLAAGTALHGALAMLAFAAGTTPLLLLAQFGLGALSRGPLARHRESIQRGLLAVSALALVWRGYAAASGAPCH
jgi:hypothetical protein